MKLNIKELVGENCITLDDGQKVYEQIHPRLKDSQPVELNFSGISVFASPFFNTAIGQLLRDIKADDLNRLLSVTNISPVGRDVLKRVIENSKAYYTDENLRKALDEILSEQTENK